MTSINMGRNTRWRRAALVLIVITIAGAVDPEVAATSSTDNYFPASVLSRPIPADAPLAPNSNELVQELRNEAFAVAPDVSYNCRQSLYAPSKWWTADEQRWCHRVNYLPDINTDAFAPTLFTATATQPTVKVRLDINNPSMAAAVAAVPVPDGAVAAPGTDGQMIIWQPATDTMWEFWHARKLSDGWHAGVAGRITNASTDPGHYTDVPNLNHRCSVDPAVTWCERASWGGPSSKIPNLIGLMTLNQLESGHIDHALAFAIPDNLQNAWTWPAQGTDGTGNSQIPQGARFRIDPNLDLDAWFASLKNPDGTPRPVPPILRMMAEAAQTYGIVLVNTSMGVAFYGENWHDGATDIYHQPGGLFGGLKPWQFMTDLPWEHMQALQEDMCDGASVPGQSTTPCAPPAHVTVPLDRVNLSCKPPVPTSPLLGDATGPVVTITTPANGSVQTGRSTFSAFASDPSGVDRVEFYVDGDLRFTSDYPHCAMNRMQYTYGGLAGVWDTSTETTGTHVLTVRAVDALGNASEAHVTVQTAAMSAAAGGSTGVQVPRMMRPAAQLQTHRSFLVAWGPEVIGTVGDYDVDVTEAPPGKGFSPSRRWLTATTDRTRVFRKAQPGATYCLSARMRTPLGALSPWSPKLCTSIPFDDRGLSARRGNWSRLSGRRLYLGTSSVSDQHGAELTRRGVLATHLLLIGTRCRSCGTVEVYWKGKPIRRISLAAHRTRRRSRFDVADFPRVERGTLTIKVLTSGRPVRIDGLGASRS